MSYNIVGKNINCILINNPYERRVMGMAVTRAGVVVVVDVGK